jgi:Rieske Fe-S protein
MKKELKEGKVAAICTHYGCGGEMKGVVIRNDSDTNDLMRWTCPVCGWEEEECWD